MRDEDACNFVHCLLEVWQDEVEEFREVQCDTMRLWAELEEELKEADRKLKIYKHLCDIPLCKDDFAFLTRPMFKSLEGAGINTLSELINKSDKELLQIPGLKENSLSRIKYSLSCLRVTKLLPTNV